MSMPAIFFTADEATAKAVRLGHMLPPEDYEQLGGVDTLKMSTLLAILEGRPWSVEMLDAFEEIFCSESEWLNRIPDSLVKKMALLEDSQLDAVAKKWAATDEMRCEPSEAAELFRTVAPIAARSILTHRSMFLFVSL